MAPGDRSLAPGDVLMQDLVQPGTNAIFVPGGTVLTAEVIMKIRQAGLEELALECVANKRTALHAGINLKRFDPRGVLSATEIAQMRAERLIASATELRSVLWLLMAAATVFAVFSRSAQFMLLTGLVYLGLVAAYGVTSTIATSHKRRIIQLKNQEHVEADQKRKFLERVTKGDPEAVAEVIIEGVVGKNRVIMLDIDKGYIVLHVILRDTVEVAQRAGVELSGRPTLGRDRSTLRSHRLATTPEVSIILETAAETLAGVFAFSPSTYNVSLSLFDPFEETVSKRSFLGCLASISMDRYQFEAMSREGDPAAFLGRSEILQLEFERNGSFCEVDPAVYSAEIPN